ncbi:hypothetical protein HW555_009112, partial [Spodoptera exigua]
GTKKGQLTKFNNFVTTLSEFPVQTVTSKQNKELIVRLSKIEGIIHEFDEIQTKIELMTEDPKQLIERDLFEDFYYSSIASAQEVAESYSKANPNQGIDVTSQPSYKSANTWKMGRVQQVYPGSDGVVRVADFKTYRGTERRAVNKVCPLLTNQEEEAE